MFLPVLQSDGMNNTALLKKHIIVKQQSQVPQKNYWKAELLKKKYGHTYNSYRTENTRAYKPLMDYLFRLFANKRTEVSSSQIWFENNLIVLLALGMW